MLSLLVAFFLVAIITSFLCSLWEAVLLSITPAYARLQLEQGGRTGARLERFKRNIDQPLAAILTLNTVAHTVGAAGVGYGVYVGIAVSAGIGHGVIGAGVGAFDMVGFGVGASTPQSKQPPALTPQFTNSCLLVQHESASSTTKPGANSGSGQRSSFSEHAVSSHMPCSKLNVCGGHESEP